MKKICFNRVNVLNLLALLLFVSWSNISIAQDNDSTAPAVPKYKPVKYTFAGPLLIDDQTVMIPTKGSLQFAIQHRFGNANNYSDIYGLFNITTMRIGFNYVPVKNVEVGFGLCSYNVTWDLNLKIALMRQSEEGGWPLSISYYGNIGIDSRDQSNFVSGTDRYSYFNEIMIARKINDNFSAQLAPQISYFNNVPGYIDAKNAIQPTMQNMQFSFSAIGRYKLSPKMAIIADYVQPMTQNPTNNPYPNMAFGIEFETIQHSFQLFVSNFGYCDPQLNNFLNQNDWTKKGNYMFGFNITRKFNTGK